MSETLKIVIAQINPMVGDIDANAERIITMAHQARDNYQAHLVLFPELTLTGYPPEDLLLRPSLELRINRALKYLQQNIKDVAVVVGCPLGSPLCKEGKENDAKLDSDEFNCKALFNAAVLISDGEIRHRYYKQHLPNYQVFDEVRYFTPGLAEQNPPVFKLRGVVLAISICEDIWFSETISRAKTAGAQLMLNLNASPYHQGKHRERQETLIKRFQESAMPIIYANMVGGQDELVFDGGSMVCNEKGEICFIAPFFTEGLFSLEFQNRLVEDDKLKTTGKSKRHELVISSLPESGLELSEDARLYQALTLGLKDYIEKNRFKGIVLGLSGGIDSALSLAIAVDALGPDRVEAVMMPFHYTSQMSLEDAEAEAKTLGVKYRVLPIADIYDAYMNTLDTVFADLEPNDKDTTRENLQARCRGVLLMALSNKLGHMVLTTGNKSEMAVGYATLYGDMIGGFNVLKDVYKTKVFSLANYRNNLTSTTVIPQRVIERSPSAELAPDQVDEDSLPPYSDLDQILEYYIEYDYSAQAIANKGFDLDTVKHIVRLVDLNEYKRSQSPIGVRVTRRGFGKDRRYPITSRWPAGD